MTLTVGDITVLGVLWAVLALLTTEWTKARLHNSIKHEYDKQLEDFKYETRKREQASRVARLLALAHDPQCSVREFNELAWELSLWLPKDLVWELTRCLCGDQGAKHPKDILIEVRKVLNGKDDGLVAGQIVHRGVTAPTTKVSATAPSIQECCQTKSLPNRFYRVVDDSPRDGRPAEQSTYRRWNRKEYHSTNEGPPTQWTRAWDDGKRNVEDFPLSCPTGLYTASARDLFLQLAETTGLNSKEMTKLQYLIGEQDGVHCCKTPQDVWTHVAGTIEGNYIVEFSGKELVGQAISEGYGVQVRDVQPIGEPIPAEEFGVKHGLPLPENPADFVDENDYEE